MDTFQSAPPLDEAALEAAHYSTGRLTAAQAAVVDRWRARLLEDRPLPGQPRAPEMLRVAGIDNRPRASCSDVIAAAAHTLLARKPPTGLDLARYAEAGRLAAVHGGPAAPICQPVSFYLPADLATAVEELRARAVHETIAERNGLRHEAEQHFPGDLDQQAAWFSAQLTHRNLPVRVRQVPRGALARMAIDQWRRRPVDQVAAEAVAYAADAHRQVHRARRDMRRLQP
jgi:hypothetical protein